MGQFQFAEQAVQGEEQDPVPGFHGAHAQGDGQVGPDVRLPWRTPFPVAPAGAGTSTSSLIGSVPLSGLLVRGRCTPLYLQGLPPQRHMVGRDGLSTGIDRVQPVLGHTAVLAVHHAQAVIQAEVHRHRWPQQAAGTLLRLPRTPIYPSQATTRGSR